MADFDEQNDELPSKSQRKRDMLALQKLGEKLAKSDSRLLDECALPPALRKALDEYQRLPNKHEARRRQLQYIGKLMRSVETSRIEEVLNEKGRNVEASKRGFQRLEALRDDLLAGDDARLSRLADEYPQLDIQFVRQVVRQSRKEQALGKNGSARKLFRYLREQGVHGEDPNAG